MKIIIAIAVLLIALAVVAYVVNNIVMTKNLRRNDSEYKNMFCKMFTQHAFDNDKKGDYLVTKYWYKTGNRSSEIVPANNPTMAYDRMSDDRRNLDYYIEKVEKL